MPDNNHTPHPSLTDVKAVVFDAYGTLFDLEAPLIRRRERLGDIVDRLSELWRRKQLEYSWLRTLMGRHVDFWRVTGDALDNAMATCGLDDPGLRAELMQLYLDLPAYPGTRETLETIKGRGLKTAILSNGTPSMLSGCINTAALAPHLDAILSAETVGAFKPHATVYQLAVERLEIPPQQIAFVSANSWDICGASVFGFHSVRLEHKPTAPEGLPEAPVATVRSLDALLPLLPG